jgi:hypothetical protein
MGVLMCRLSTGYFFVIPVMISYTESDEEWGQVTEPHPSIATR